MKIDYISDLHLDFHVKHNSNDIKWQKQTELFLESLLPEILGEVLIIAGDISHYIQQKMYILNYFSKLYKQVYFVLGNHSFYIISNNQNKKYKSNSNNKIFELKQNIKNIDNVTLLENYKVYKYNGIKFAGATNWYPLIEHKDIQFFKSMSNDSRLIKELNIKELNHFETERYKNLKEVDIIVTHVPPITVNSHHKYGSTSCYLNELKPLKAKHYVFGHVHEQNVYEKSDSKFYINALGYPAEFTNWMSPLDYKKDKRIDFWNEWKKIKSFEV